MKKLFFSALFLFGMLAAVQAQLRIDYHIENFSTTSTWDYGLAEANGASTSGTLAPGGSVTANLTTNGNFPINWRVANNLGCQYQQQDNGPVFPEVIVNFPCLPAASAVYKIEQIGFNHYIFKMGLN